MFGDGIYFVRRCSFLLDGCHVSYIYLRCICLMRFVAGWEVVLKKC